MSGFERYFLMKEADVLAYVQTTTDFFPADAALRCKEIGDGNLNYVFRVWDENSGQSVIVKQAGVALRISAEMKVSTDRNRIEAEILEIQDKLAPGLVPKLYKYDTTMCCFIMEDLSDFSLMRYAMMRHEIFPRFAEDITTFMVNTLLDSSDVVMEHKEKKDWVKRFINPELCEITEELVLTEPVNDNKGRNLLFPPNAAFVQAQLYEDEPLQLELAKLKFNFMNNAQALLHGDLHTGSIFVKPERTVVFDPEFAFYGPMGYDIGNVVANLMFAWDNGDAYGAAAFCEWILRTLVAVVDLFIEKFRRRFAERATEVMAKTPAFLDWYLGEILADTAGYCGTELLRRTVGLAQNKDVTTIQDSAKRARAERINILAAKDFIMRRAEFSCGQDFLDCFLKAVNRAPSA